MKHAMTGTIVRAKVFINIFKSSLVIRHFRHTAQFFCASSKLVAQEQKSRTSYTDAP